MKTNLVRKIALVMVIVMALCSFAGCKRAGGNNEALKQVIEMEGVAGDEIVIEIPAPGEESEEEDENTNNDDENTGGENTGDENTGDENTGDENTGDENTGDENTGDENTGDENTGDENTGDENTGDENTSDENTGDENTDDENTGDENTGDENTGDEDGDGEPVEKPAYDPNKAFKIMSYNIKCAWYGKTIDQVASQIKEENPDIVGLQEVDCNSNRKGNVISGIDQVKIIAEKAGYPYYAFEPVIDLTAARNEQASADLRENAYGHAIMSKYPIKKSEIIWPEAQAKGADKEVRNFGRHEIDVGGKTVVFYNCHLDFSLGREQYFEVQEKYMSKDKYAVCVGDFNETFDEFSIYFDFDKFYNFSFGDDSSGKSQVYRGTETKKSQVIDHIIVSKDTFVWKDDEVQNGYYSRPHDGASDHAMIYAYVNLLD